MICLFYILCMYVRICACECTPHVQKSEDSLACQSLLPPLSATGSFAVSCCIHHTIRSIYFWGLETCATTAGFPLVLGIQTQTLTLAQQGLYLRSCLLNGKHDILTRQNRFEFEQYKRAWSSHLVTGPCSASMTKHSCPMLGDPL